MALLLNRSIVWCLLLCGILSFGQTTPQSVSERKTTEKDYRKKVDYKKFRKYNAQIAAWQIQNLRFGALVVRLQNNQKKIDACRKVGNVDLENKIRSETQYYNKLMIQAYTDEFHFCKVYFIFAQYSDSLLNGLRKGIFIDSTLQINNAIEMTEAYYILAEKDYVFNSSIGLVKEDTAKFISENGNPAFQAPVVLKNKFGHQLKAPFPFYVNRVVLKGNTQHSLQFKYLGYDGKNEVIMSTMLTLPKELSIEKQKLYIFDLNLKLEYFYQQNQGKQANLPNVQWYLY